MSQDEQQPLVAEQPAATLAETSAPKRKFPVIKIRFKTLIWALIILLILGGGYYFKSVFIAAWVNGRPVSRLVVIDKLEKESGKSVLESMINERLINDEVKQRKINISDEDVNNRIKTIEDQIKSQGSTLDDELVNAGLTRETLKDQIKTQLQLEKMLEGKVDVSDSEVADYISSNKITIPAGQEETYKSQIKDQIKQQKLSNESQTLLDDLKAKAKIKYFVTY